jgi:hypothetical protein
MNESSKKTKEQKGQQSTAKGLSSASLPKKITGYTKKDGKYVGRAPIKEPS